MQQPGYFQPHGHPANGMELHTQQQHAKTGLGQFVPDCYYLLVELLKPVISCEYPSIKPWITIPQQISPRQLYDKW
jgi:hypothetical protein